MRSVYLAATLVFALAPPAFGDSGYTKAQATKILRTAEEIRSLDKARLKVTLTTTAAGQTTAYELDVLRTTEKRALVDFLAPQEEHGRRMLANRNNYWSTFPDSKRVVAVSRREMIGNSAFALADIFQLDADHDYNTEVVGKETLGGAPCLKLDLKAKSDEAPYDRIIYFVNEKDSFPVLAHFYGPSGKLLKTMSVISKREIAGRLRPDKLRMVDEVTKGKESVWVTHTMVPENPPDEVFTKDYLKVGN